MAFDFRHTVEIECEAARAFAFISEFENNPRWQGGMRECIWTSATRGQVGATYRQRAVFLGRPIDTHFRVVELEPGSCISIESTHSPFPIQVTRAVEALGPGRCRVRAHVRGQPRGVMSLMSSLVRRSIRADYRRLEAVLASQGSS